MYFDEIVSTFTDIKGIGITITIYGRTFTFGFGETNGETNGDNVSSLLESEANGEDTGLINVDITITYSQYEADEEAYFEYLKNEYIPKMPEFKNIVYDKDGNLIDSKVNGIIDDIKMLSSTWEEIYGDGDGTAEGNNLCIGDINTEILDKLSPPVQIETGTPITFTTKTAFGTTSFGKMHNGVDINEESAGVGVGTAVSSVYAGTVVASTASNDFSDDEKSGDGGWVKIEHTIPYTGDEGESVDAHVYTIYGGLDPTSVPTTGTAVSAGQQIGVIGDVIYSEDGVTPGLHFGFYDISSRKYLNPLNVFIYCGNLDKYNEGNICVYDSEGGLVIDFPRAIMEYPQWNYDIECYSAEYGYGCKNNFKGWAYNQEIVWKQWVKSGARYKNGIAVMKVNNVDRYMVAVTAKMGQVGDIINAKLENGEIIPMIIGDIKSYGDTGVANQKMCQQIGITDKGCYGHQKGGNSIGVLEFQVDPVEYRRSSNPANWGQEWDTSQKVASITRYGSILGNTSNDDICDNAYIDPSNPNLSDVEGSISSYTQNSNNIIDTDLESYLASKGSSVAKMNQAISEAKGKAGGYCTRTAAVAVAKKLIDFMDGKGGRIPYTCGGGWGERITYAQANWGSYHAEECDTNCGSKCYFQNGLDCAGYVRWVLNTTGFSVPAHQANGFGEGFLPGAVNVKLANTQVLKAGDIMFSSGHVVFIVGVNTASKKYIIAEAAGLDSGVQYSTKSFNAYGYTGVNMDGFYSRSNEWCTPDF